MAPTATVYVPFDGLRVAGSQSLPQPLGCRPRRVPAQLGGIHPPQLLGMLFGSLGNLQFPPGVWQHLRLRMLAANVLFGAVVVGGGPAAAPLDAPTVLHFGSHARQE